MRFINFSEKNPPIPTENEKIEIINIFETSNLKKKLEMFFNKNTKIPKTALWNARV